MVLAITRPVKRFYCEDNILSFQYEAVDALRINGNDVGRPYVFSVQSEQLYMLRIKSHLLTKVNLYVAVCDLERFPGDLRKRSEFPLNSFAMRTV